MYRSIILQMNMETNALQIIINRYKKVYNILEFKCAYLLECFGCGRTNVCAHVRPHILIDVNSDLICIYMWFQVNQKPWYNNIIHHHMVAALFLSWFSILQWFYFCYITDDYVCVCALFTLSYLYRKFSAIKSIKCTKRCFTVRVHCMFSRKSIE